MPEIKDAENILFIMTSGVKMESLLSSCDNA